MYGSKLLQADICSYVGSCCSLTSVCKYVAVVLYIILMCVIRCFRFSQHVSVTHWARRTPSAIPPQASVRVCQVFMGISVPTACTANGASPTASPASATTIASTAIHRQDNVWSVGTTLPDTTVRGNGSNHRHIEFAQ